jgi:hypothetical protein
MDGPNRVQPTLRDGQLQPNPITVDVLDNKLDDNTTKGFYFFYFLRIFSGIKCHGCQ